MSNFLLMLFCILFIIVICIFLFIMYIVFKVRKSINLDKGDVTSIINVSKEAMKEEMNREKSVVGMTNLVLPQVVKDIPDFNVNMIYNAIETNLTKIFLAIEDKKYIHDNDLLLLEQTINSIIDDLKQRDIDIRYDDIIFHKHALKRYENRNGVATLTTSSSIEYYYIDSSKVKKSEVKRQTRYTCTFVYVFDYSKISNKNREKLFVLHCPNCGAPLDNFKSANCRYCMSKVGDVLAKTWKMVSYKEDYSIS